ncbi:MAG: HU family DNA-binding protein [Balneolaceae bacterium]
MSEKVTYSEIIEALSETTGISKNKSDDFVKKLIELLKEDLKASGKFTLSGFGSFAVKDISTRKGRNPQTGESLTIPAHKRLSFHPYKALKESVNASYDHLESEVIQSEPVAAPKRNIASSKKVQKSSSVAIILSGLMLLIVAISAAWYFIDENSQTNEALQTTLTTQKSEKLTTKATEPEIVQKAVESEEVVKEKPQSTKGAEQQPSSPENYQVQNDEWFWVISNKVYGKSNWWPLIYQENQHVGEDPDKLLAKIGLKIPVLKGTIENPAKEDYQKLASATKLVSETYTKFNKPEKAVEYARYAKKYERQGM